MEDYVIEKFRNGFMSYIELINCFGNRELTDKKLKEYGIDLLDGDIISYCENKVKNTNDKEEIKQIVNELFNNNEICDSAFNRFIYNNVYNKLTELGVVFKEDTNIYEEILKENY